MANIANFRLSTFDTDNNWRCPTDRWTKSTVWHLTNNKTISYLSIRLRRDSRSYVFPFVGCLQKNGSSA